MVAERKEILADCWRACRPAICPQSGHSQDQGRDFRPAALEQSDRIAAIKTNECRTSTTGPRLENPRTIGWMTSSRISVIRRTRNRQGRYRSLG